MIRYVASASSRFDRERAVPDAPCSTTSDSRRLEGQGQEGRTGLAVLQPIRDDPERQCLHPGDGNLPGLTVAHHS